MAAPNSIARVDPANKLPSPIPLAFSDVPDDWISGHIAAATPMRTTAPIATPTYF